MDIKQDNFGPEYMIEVHDPRLKMQGFLVIDNTALGPGKGGIRMTPTVTKEEVFRLARTMTWKNALAHIPFGGAKAGIVLPQGSTPEFKKQCIESFARALSPLIPKKYVGGPDVNTGEHEMEVFAEAAGNWQAVTGKPSTYCAPRPGGKGEMCGLPHELGSTGFGVAHATKVAMETIGLALRGATVAIEGFGNVGTFAFKFLKEMGANIVAVSDSRGAAYAEGGLDEEKLRALKRNRKSVSDYPGAKKLAKDDVFAIPVDILITAALTDVINDANKNSIKVKIIVEGSNIPMRENIEDELFRRGIFIVPDFVANAGGVISSYAEFVGMTPEQMFKIVEEKITKSAAMVLGEAKKQNKNPRGVAMALAERIVEKAAKQRRHTF